MERSSLNRDSTCARAREVAAALLKIIKDQIRLGKSRAVGIMLKLLVDSLKHRQSLRLNGNQIGVCKELSIACVAMA